MVWQIAKRMAIPKETCYGEVFDVVQNPGKADHLANTGLPLDLHTDLNYRDKSPGILLVCVLLLTSGGLVVCEKWVGVW